MKLRSLALVGLSLFLITPALASFDLMLMPNLAGRINRYDPENNVQLGSFAAGSAVRQVALNQAAGLAYVSDSGANKIRIFDYNTGTISANTLSITPQAMEFETSSNRLFFANGSSLSYANANLTSTAALTPTLTGIIWGSVYSLNGLVTFAGINASNNIVFESFNAISGVSVGSFVSTTATFSGARLGKAAGFVGSTNFLYGVLTYSDATGNLRLMRTFNGVIGVTGLNSQVLTGSFTSANVMPAAALSHGGFYLAGQDSVSATLTRVTQFDASGPFNLIQSNTFSGASFNSGSYQVANIVAPEPASMLAIGLGLAALAKRRSVKSSL